MLDKLFLKHERGFQRKFIKQYEEWKKCQVNNSSNETRLPFTNNESYSSSQDLHSPSSQETITPLNVSHDPSQINSPNPEQSNSMDLDISNIYLDISK